MPIEGTQFKGKIKAYQTRDSLGVIANPDPGATSSEIAPAGYFAVMTGTTGIPDVTYNQTSSVTLIAPALVPATCRCYITKLTLAVKGATAWTAGTAGLGIEIQDSAGVPIVAFPLASLVGNAAYSFPASSLWTNNTVTVTGSASTTTVTNLSSTPFVAKATCSLVGSYVTALTGTAANIGQTRRITDHDTESFTVGLAWPAAAAASDTYAVWSHQAVATTNATTLTANDSLTTATMVGKWTTVLTGTGLSQTRMVTANTNSALTVGTQATAPSTDAVFAINNVPHLLGACDFYNIERGFPAATLAKGLNAVVLGAPGAGSSVRIYVEGFYAP